MILVDRRVRGKDGKGLLTNEAYDVKGMYENFEGVIQNHTSTVRYKILFEPAELKPSEEPHFYHSRQGEKALSSLLYPPISFISSLNPQFKTFSGNWPDSIQLVTWKPVSPSVHALVLRKVSYLNSSSNNLDFISLFNFLSQKYSRIYHSKLSATVNGDIVSLESFTSALSQDFSISTFRLHI